MTQPLVTLITPTYNRPAMFAECAAAVLAQSFTDWVWWVVLNPSLGEFDDDPHLWQYLFEQPCWSDPRVLPILYGTTDYKREQRHVPAAIVNWLYPKVTTDYIYFLADDDLIDPDGLGALLGPLEASRLDQAIPGGWSDPVHATYGRCEVQDQQPDGSYKTACWTYPGAGELPAHGTWDVGLGTGIDPHCRLDGGQVLHTADLWRRATADGWQLTDSKDAGANDGILLHRLAEFATFHYVPARIVTHRRHTGATHHPPQVRS